MGKHTFTKRTPKLVERLFKETSYYTACQRFHGKRLDPILEWNTKYFSVDEWDLRWGLMHNNQCCYEREHREVGADDFIHIIQREFPAKEEACPKEPVE